MVKKWVSFLSREERREEWIRTHTIILLYERQFLPVQSIWGAIG